MFKIILVWLDFLAYCWLFNTKPGLYIYTKYLISKHIFDNILTFFELIFLLYS